MTPGSDQQLTEQSSAAERALPAILSLGLAT